LPPADEALWVNSTQSAPTALRDQSAHAKFAQADIDIVAAELMELSNPIVDMIAQGPTAMRFVWIFESFGTLRLGTFKSSAKLL
jgi:hypothetical protein